MSSFSYMITKKGMDVLKSILILAIFTFSGCRNIDKKSVDKAPYFRNEISIAERFTLKKKNGYTEVKIINPWQGANNLNLVYHLVTRGSELPFGQDSSTVIFVPVKKIVCMSTTHVAMISALGEENTISGVSGTGFIFANSLIEKVKNGLIGDVGYEANLNKELILKISPDLIMMYGIGSESAGYVGKIKELGVKVIFNADYLETDPLGKAEWIKLFGALYCRENLADSIYRSEVETYNKLKSYINKNISFRPKVLLGLPFKDAWYISPGNSFISKLIEDAGGSYLWQSTESSVSMPFGIENVYLGALTADYWLNIGIVNTRDEISMVDQRLKDLPCFKNGNLYNNNKRVTENGGNDYWEKGSLYPHLILKDIASILHPDLFSDNELFFYRKID
ncbi:MAG: ABC transporter substrate-binding protein [Bacteroidia bacterium]|nr:ABC transporter substrate-binding protein [Bacteroidia bacterium]